MFVERANLVSVPIGDEYRVIGSDEDAVRVRDPRLAEGVQILTGGAENRDRIAGLRIRDRIAPLHCVHVVLRVHADVRDLAQMPICGQPSPWPLYAVSPFTELHEQAIGLMR